MTIKEAIKELKETIKSLTDKQIQDKKELRQPHNYDTYIVQTAAWNRSAEITVFLNLYNELRGEEYRHSIEKFDSYLVNRVGKQLDKYSELLEVEAA